MRVKTRVRRQEHSSSVSNQLKMTNLNGSPPADNESGVVLPTQAAWVHVWPKMHIVPHHICDALFWIDVIDFNPLKDNNCEDFYTNECARRPFTDCTLTTLLAQAIRFALHLTFVMVPSPSWTTDIFHRFNQFLSYRSSYKKEEMSNVDLIGHICSSVTGSQGCSCADGPTGGSRWLEHCTGVVGQCGLPAKPSSGFN